MVHQELAVLLVLQEQMVHQVFLDLQELLELVDLQDQVVAQAHLDNQEIDI
jgi:hypothetical protein